jgi:hypothetical protein
LRHDPLGDIRRREETKLLAKRLEDIVDRLIVTEVEQLRPRVLALGSHINRYQETVIPVVAGRAFARKVERDVRIGGYVQEGGRSAVMLKPSQ